MATSNQISRDVDFDVELKEMLKDQSKIKEVRIDDNINASNNQKNYM